MSEDGGGGRYAEVDIFTGSPPLSGQLLVEPMTGGTSLITVYTLRALHWTDEYNDMPLKYRYGYSHSQFQSGITWITPLTGRNNILSVLPLAVHDNSSLLLALQIFDTRGSVNMVWKSISVSQPNTLIDLTVIMQNIQALSLLEKRLVEGLATLTVTLSSLSNSTSNMVVGGEDSVRYFKMSSIDLALNLLSTQLPHDKAFTSIVLNILRLALPDIQLPINTVASLLQGMESIVNSYITSSDVFLDNGLSRQEAELILSIFDHLGESHRSNEINYDQYRIISNQIDTSYQAVSDRMGYGLCQQLEAQEEVVSLTSPYFGLMKVFYRIPPWDFSIACNHEEPDCPVLTSSVTFGERVFQEYVQRYCKTLSSLGNFTSCEGVCIMSRQAALDSHWNGSPFSSHVKSQPVRIDVFSKERVNDRLMINVPVLLSLYYPVSNNGVIECVYWNNVTEQWAQCLNTTIVSQYYI